MLEFDQTSHQQVMLGAPQNDGSNDQSLANRESYSQENPVERARKYKKRIDKWKSEGKCENPIVRLANELNTHEQNIRNDLRLLEIVSDNKELEDLIASGQIPVWKVIALARGKKKGRRSEEDKRNDELRKQEAVRIIMDEVRSKSDQHKRNAEITSKLRAIQERKTIRIAIKEALDAVLTAALTIKPHYGILPAPEHEAALIEAITALSKYQQLELIRGDICNAITDCLAILKIVEKAIEQDPKTREEAAIKEKYANRPRYHVKPEFTGGYNIPPGETFIPIDLDDPGIDPELRQHIGAELALVWLHNSPVFRTACVKIKEIEAVESTPDQAQATDPEPIGAAISAHAKVKSEIAAQKPDEPQSVPAAAQTDNAPIITKAVIAPEPALSEEHKPENPAAAPEPAPAAAPSAQPQTPKENKAAFKEKYRNRQTFQIKPAYAQKYNISPDEILIPIDRDDPTLPSNLRRQLENRQVQIWVTSRSYFYVIVVNKGEIEPTGSIHYSMQEPERPQKAKPIPQAVIAAKPQDTTSTSVQTAIAAAKSTIPATTPTPRQAVFAYQSAPAPEAAQSTPKQIPREHEEAALREKYKNTPTFRIRSAIIHPGLKNETLIPIDQSDESTKRYLRKYYSGQGMNGEVIVWLKSNRGFCLVFLKPWEIIPVSDAPTPVPAASSTTTSGGAPIKSAAPTTKPSATETTTTQPIKPGINAPIEAVAQKPDEPQPSQAAAPAPKPRAARPINAPIPAKAVFADAQSAPTPTLALATAPAPTPAYTTPNLIQTEQEREEAAIKEKYAKGQEFRIKKEFARTYITPDKTLIKLDPNDPLVDAYIQKYLLRKKIGKDQTLVLLKDPKIFYLVFVKTSEIESVNSTPVSAQPPTAAPSTTTTPSVAPAQPDKQTRTQIPSAAAPTVTHATFAGAQSATTSTLALITKASAPAKPEKNIHSELEQYLKDHPVYRVAKPYTEEYKFLKNDDLVIIDLKDPILAEIIERNGIELPETSSHTNVLVWIKSRPTFVPGRIKRAALELAPEKPKSTNDINTATSIDRDPTETKTIPRKDVTITVEGNFTDYELSEFGITSFFRETDKIDASEIEFFPIPTSPDPIVFRFHCPNKKFPGTVILKTNIRGAENILGRVKTIIASIINRRSEISNVQITEIQEINS